MEAELKVQSFFVMDENFLLHRERAMRLLERMKETQKSWSMSVFASANAIRKYTMQELVELGVSWLWMGLESPQASYNKLQGTDTRQLTRELREHGIRVQGSTIIGLEHHTPDNIVAEIEHAVSHDTDFHQFMLYTPVPGTPLYQQMSEEGRMLRDVDYADVHGQFKFNFKHAAISREDSKRFLDWAFWRDFEANGPSLYRISRTLLAGWKRYKDWPDARVRERFTREMHKLNGVYSSALWAMERQFRKVDGKVSDQIRALREEFKQELHDTRWPRRGSRPARSKSSRHPAVSRYREVRSQPVHRAGPWGQVIGHGAGQEPASRITLALVEPGRRPGVLDDGDLVEPLPLRVEQREAVLDSEDETAAVAQPGRPDRLARPGTTWSPPVAGSNRCTSPGRMSSHTSRCCFSSHTGPSPRVARPSKAMSGRGLAGIVAPLARAIAHRTPNRS